jgi:hypothetical protein
MGIKQVAEEKEEAEAMEKDRRQGRNRKGK